MHEVGQVVAAAGPAGAAAVSVAIVVKLTRVLLLAPVVAGVSMLRRRRAHVEGTKSHTIKAIPIVPLFVLAFLGFVALRSTGILPESALGVAEQLQTVTLGAALFGMGTGVHLASMLRGSGPILLVSAISTLVVASVSLAGVLLLV